ncbi:MAG TPA: glycosyltransferase family 87 protein [Gemmataceae bacterium]
MKAFLPGLRLSAPRGGWLRRDLWLRWGVTVWAVLFLAIAGRVIFSKPRSHTVYPIYTTAAGNWLAGKNLYLHTEPGLDVYRYHPAFAATFYPWALLPEKLGEVLWRGLNAGVFLLGLGAWARRVLPEHMSERRFGLLLLLTVPLSLHSLNNGQANLLLIGLLMLGTADAARRRWTRASGWVALATVLKVYPLALGLLLAALYPRRFLPRYLLWLAAGFAVPFLLQRPEYVLDQYRWWVEAARIDDRLAAPLERCTVDAYMVCRVWLGEPPRALYRAAQLAAAGLIALICLRRQRQGAPARALLAPTFHLACLWMLLFGPATESCTYTLLAPTLAAVLLLPPPGRTRPAWAALAAACGLLLYQTLAGALPKPLRPGPLALQPVAALLVAAVVAREAVARPGRQSGREAVASGGASV